MQVRLCISVVLSRLLKYLRYSIGTICVIRTMIRARADRDFLVLSKGHGVMAQYACMYELGWLNRDAVFNYFSDGTELKGLSDSRVRVSKLLPEVSATGFRSELAWLWASACVVGIARSTR